MKNTIVLCLALALSSSVYAQFISVGPKIGISHSTITAEGIDEIKAGDSSVGFHAGLFARVSFLGFYVQPEALFTSTSGQIVINEPGSTTVNAVQEITYNKLDVPVMLGFKVGNIFRINAGPSFSLLLNRDARKEGTTAEIVGNYKDATVGYQLGIGFDISRLILDLRYENNLSALGDELTIAGQTFDTDIRNRLFILSLGYKLFK